MICKFIMLIIFVVIVGYIFNTFIDNDSNI